MSEASNDDRTLSKNRIKSFILKIDLIKKDGLDIRKIAEKMSQYFDRTEKRQVSNFTINFTKGNSELSTNQAFDYVLVSESKSVAMTFSEIQNAFWIECAHYKNNNAYKDFIKKVIEIVQSCTEGAETKRIGMRYVNEFTCGKVTNIGRIFGKRLSSILKVILKEKQQIRSIVVEEYNNDGYKLRLQYGVPNKFYPSVFTVYDLLLDIDAYIDNTCKIDDWENIITVLNHSAYELFIKEMNEKYLTELK